MTYEIPGHGHLTLETVIFDLNGTLSVGGVVHDGVAARLKRLQASGYDTILFTGNTRNDADIICDELGINWRQARTAIEKRQLAESYKPETAVAIGNGRIDYELISSVALGIVTLQAEGVHTQTLLKADIVIPSIVDALDLLLEPERLIATMRY